MTDKKPKPDDVLTEKNIEHFIKIALEKYSLINREYDRVFWQEAVRLYGNKRYEQGKLEAFLAKKTLEKNLLEQMRLLIKEMNVGDSNDEEGLTICSARIELYERLKSQLSKSEGAKK